MKTIYLFAFLCISIKISGQIAIPYDEIVVIFNDSNCFGYTPIYSEEVDTLNYHILLESYFISDTVKIFSNDSLLFKDIVNTDQSLGFAKEIIIGSVKQVTNFKLKINNYTTVNCSLLPDLKYIRVGLSWDRMTLILCYSKYHPIYY
jgi:hypothetical protein